MENMSTSAIGEDVYEDLDSRVCRTNEKFQQLYKEACITHTRVDGGTEGFAKDLFPVRLYAQASWLVEFSRNCQVI